ncbi:toll/interleukin-1 receptor domain-containing protein [Streptomyces sp. NPDC004539]|uniref:toll/interleukin-1 receptor domain-containing protein n=1 Tax=Streptomyces sp. NPDC004539 TaxID=3154280 RepID=UPI0033BD925B
MTERPPFFFTSYAERRADNSLVEAFHRRLQQEAEIKRGRSASHDGFLNVGSLELGEGWRLKIGSALGRTRFLVVLLTDDYLVSPWCAREWAVVRDRVRRAAPEEPIAVLPLFWTRLSRELPAEIADLQLRMAALGTGYTDTCLVDLMRGDTAGYERFVIGLTDHMVKAAAVELPEMDAESAAYYPPAFGLGAPESTAAAEEASREAAGEAAGEAGKPTAEAAREAAKPTTEAAKATAEPPAPPAVAPFGPTERRALIEAFLRSPLANTHETYNLWLESVRLFIAPAQLAPGTDSGSLRNRVIALVNFARKQPTPAVLLAFAECLADLGDDEATTEVRRLVDLAAADWS